MCQSKKSFASVSSYPCHVSAWWTRVSRVFTEHIEDIPEIEADCSHFKEHLSVGESC
jgi:hypothetical protein